MIVITPILTKKIQPFKIETSNEIKESAFFFWWFLFAIILIILLISPLTITLSPLLWGLITATRMTITCFVIPSLTLACIRTFSIKSLDFSRIYIKQNILASIIMFLGIIIIGLLIDVFLL